MNDILKLFKWYSNERKAVGSGHVRKDRAHRFFVRVVFVLFETRRFCKVERFVFPDLKDLVIYSICVSEPKEEWEECLNEYSLKNRGIECIYASDYFGKDNLQKIRKQWKIDRMPYYLLINRKGQIVDFGTTARPSNPQLVSRIEDALK